VIVGAESFAAEGVRDGRRHFASPEAEAAQRRKHLRGRLERRLAFQLSFRADSARHLGATTEKIWPHDKWTRTPAIGWLPASGASERAGSLGSPLLALLRLGAGATLRRMKMHGAKDSCGQTQDAGSRTEARWREHAGLRCISRVVARAQ
jgi:hypothetical protein